MVHGHFYQPPRENPWTDEPSREPSASPFHDWNFRINAECYRANASARLYGLADRIRAIINNYQHLSFNFGPTLARWIERHDPRTLTRIAAGDEEQQRRLGHGGAMAQVWGHPIAPLLSRNDRRTQVLWGLFDFEKRFGRAAEGIWLPETAADEDTLEDLIDLGLRYTIVAPEQITRVRPAGGTWTAVNRETVDTGRAYQWRHRDGSGRFISLAVFNGPVSRELAFGDATANAAAFLGRMTTAALLSDVTEQRLVLAASDGELYGHHKKFADLTLAYATTVEAPKHDVEVTNLAAYLHRHPATWEAELGTGDKGEGSSWSCDHGLGRWRRHCGCAFNPRESPSQAWRGPLRDAMDYLADAATEFFEDAGAELFLDPWNARDGYGLVIDSPPEARQVALREFGRKPLTAGRDGLGLRAVELMEMQRALLAMYASCGWFFDDVGGLESSLILRQAAYAMDLWRTLGGQPPEAGFLDILQHAQSNRSELGTGADVYRRTLGDRVTPAQAVAAAVFAELATDPEREAGQVVSVPGFEVRLNQPAKVQADSPRARVGRAELTAGRTGRQQMVSYRAIHDGSIDFQLETREERITLADLPSDAREPVVNRVLTRLAGAPTTLPLCRMALALLPPSPGPAPAEEQALFGQLLLNLQDPLRPADFTAEVIDVLTQLVDRAGLPANHKTTALLQEVAFDKLVEFRHEGRPLPPGLRAIGERLGLALDEEVA